MTTKTFNYKGLLIPATICLGLISINTVNAMSKNDVLKVIKSQSSEYGIHPELISAMVQVESNFNTHAISNKGAEGLMQIMPDTQKLVEVTDPFNAKQNIKGGIRYFIVQLQHFGSVRKALWAYNAGPSRVERQQIPEESRQYANRILQIFWQKYANKL